MEDKTFADLIVKIRKDAQMQIREAYMVGEVISESPLRVEVGGTVQDETNLLLSGNLYLEGEMLKLRRISDGIEVDYHPPDKLRLSKKDTILLIPIEEQQKFIIVCKVVRV